MKKTLLVEDLKLNLATMLLSRVERTYLKIKSKYYTIQIVQGTSAVSIVIPAKDDNEAKRKFTEMAKLFKELLMLKKHKCIKLANNSRMGCTECWAKDNLIFYFDYNNKVKVGDTVEIEKDGKGFNKKVYVNGILIFNKEEING